MIKRKLLTIFISICAVLLMSHNSFAAITPGYSVVAAEQSKFYITNWACGSPSCPGGFGGGNSWTTDINGYNNDLIREFRLDIPDMSYKQGDIITIELFFILANIQANHSAFSAAITSSPGMHIADIEFNQLSDNAGVAKIYVYALRDVSANYINITSPRSNGAILILNSSSTSSNEAQVRLGAATVWRPNGAIDYSSSISNISNQLNNLKQQEQQQQQKEDQAIDNIENQSPSDLNTGDNSSATNLIGVLSSFLSYISNFQAGSCVVNLPFPAFAGGTWQMNLCQYKDKAGQIVSVFSSLTLIVFFIPVCLKLLTMIYSEIRSFTNG